MLKCTKEKRIAVYQQHYKRICIKDDHCLQLKQKFLLAFKQRNDEEVSTWLVEFPAVYELVYKISTKHDPSTVHSIWVVCCQFILYKWSKKLENYHNDDLLIYVLSCWRQYRDGVNLIQSLSLYAENQLAGKSDKSHMNEICCYIFVQYFIQIRNNSKLLFDSIMYVIENNQINTGLVKLDLVKQILKLFQYVDSRNNIIYYRVFGFPYLKKLQNVHRQQSDKLIQSMPTIIDYVRFVENIIDQEITLANECAFTPPMIRMMAKLLYCEMITKHQSAICDYDSFEKMIVANKWDELNYLYKIIHYDDEVLKAMAANLERFIKAEMSKIMLTNWTDKWFTKEQVFAFIDRCNTAIQNWIQICKKKFGDHAIINQAATNSFLYYFNFDPVYICITSVFVHVLAMKDCPFIEDTESKRQEMIQKTFKLQSYIKDKTLLIDYSRHFLCKRVFYQLSYDTEKDIDLIGGMMESLSADNSFSVKLLLKDMKLAHNTQNLTGIEDAKFELTILNASLWNFDKTATFFWLPNSFFELYTKFWQAFSDRNPKKSLKLNRHHGTAEMEAHFDNYRRKVNFIVSLKQASILLSFNSYSTLTFDNLSRQINMDPESLVHCLKVFCSQGLLLTDDETKPWTEMTYTINEHYKPQSDTVNWVRAQYLSAEYNLNHIMHQNFTSNPSQSSGEHLESNENVVDVRIEAAIIRILKKLQTLNDIKQLHKVTFELLDKTIKNNKVLPLNDFKKIVTSLEKRGYLQLTHNGHIVYLP